MTDKKEEKVSPITKILPSEYECREFTAFVPSGVVFKDVLDPTYWSYVANKFTAFRTYLDVIADDGSWVARLLVTASDRSWAKVLVIYHHKIGSETKQPENSNFKVEFVPAHKWRVVRLADNEVLQKDMASRDEANAWLKEHEITLAR